MNNHIVLRATHKHLFIFALIFIFNFNQMSAVRRVIGFMKILFGDDIADDIRRAKYPLRCAAGIYYSLTGKFIPDILYKGDKRWCVDIWQSQFDGKRIFIYSKVKVHRANSPTKHHKQHKHRSQSRASANHYEIDSIEF